MRSCVRFRWGWRIGESSEISQSKRTEIVLSKYFSSYLTDKFLSCAFDFCSVVHPSPTNFLCFFFCLLPVIQFFDTARVDRTRSWLYAACSVSYLGAMVSSNSALQFVNYPTQVKPQGGVRVGSEVQKDERFFPQVCDLNKRRMCLGN